MALVNGWASAINMLSARLVLAGWNNVRASIYSSLGGDCKAAPPKKVGTSVRQQFAVQSARANQLATATQRKVLGLGAGWTLIPDEACCGRSRFRTHQGSQTTSIPKIQTHGLCAMLYSISAHEYNSFAIGEAFPEPGTPVKTLLSSVPARLIRKDGRHPRQPAHPKWWPGRKMGGNQNGASLSGGLRPVINTKYTHSTPNSSAYHID